MAGFIFFRGPSPIDGAPFGSGQKQSHYSLTNSLVQHRLKAGSVNSVLLAKRAMARTALARQALPS